jgi:AAA15 family ATPase/GTPase
MKINSIKLANILSFGQEQNLEAFSDFNLFIGKNGSGKTNVLRLLGKLNISLENVENNSYVQNHQQELFTAYLDLSYKKRNSLQGESYLEVEYDVSQGSYLYKGNPIKNIVFRERDFKIKLEKGDIAKFKNQIIILDQHIPDNIFFKALTELGKKPINLKILNEGLCYIAYS